MHTDKHIKMNTFINTWKNLSVRIQKQKKNNALHIGKKNIYKHIYALETIINTHKHTHKHKNTHTHTHIYI